MNRGKQNKVLDVVMKAVRLMARSTRGAAHLDLVVVILIGVVLGGLLLTGLYSLYDTQVMPNLSTKVMDMFNYTP